MRWELEELEEDEITDMLSDEHLRDLTVRCYSNIHRPGVVMEYNEDFDCYFCIECSNTVSTDRESMLEYWREVSQ